MFAPAGQTTASAGQLCWLTALVVRRQAVKTPPYDAKDTGRKWQGCGPGMPGPYGVFLRQRHVDLILDGKAVDRQLCHRYGQPLGKCAAVEP